MQKYRSKAINISDEMDADSVVLTPNFVPLLTSIPVSSALYVANNVQGQHLQISFAGEKHDIYEVPNGVSTKLLSGISGVTHKFKYYAEERRYKRTGSVTAVSDSVITVTWGSESVDADLGPFSNTYSSSKTLKINNEDVTSDFGVWVLASSSLNVYADQYIYLGSGDILRDYAIAYNADLPVPFSNNNSVQYTFGKAGTSLVVGDTITATYVKFESTPELSNNIISRLIRLNMIEEYEED